MSYNSVPEILSVTWHGHGNSHFRSQTTLLTLKTCICTRLRNTLPLGGGGGRRGHHLSCQFTVESQTENRKQKQKITKVTEFIKGHSPNFSELAKLSTNLFKS